MNYEQQIDEILHEYTQGNDIKPGNSISESNEYKKARHALLELVNGAKLKEFKLIESKWIRLSDMDFGKFLDKREAQLSPTQPEEDVK